ncbi:rRNA maturation factor [Porphyromonas sp. HMSC077F02]|mgnify:CR=1 FL=1|uniref:rRNA maturation RNase YbeY n=1 Tax=Porphyromonas TaxID=836 RepID=UPI0003414EB2|nr:MULTISPECIES: rRNA maturation RNase YbeY [Porphyromonas]OFO57862.1 rRNA maturation factor [Porphyromonas sp. HMSC077F02]CCY09374.1 probable rRNA maturation factor [Porphyromonas sp. CAG:1061]
MAINYYGEGVTIPAFRRREVNAWIKDVAEEYGYEVGDITYQFCDNERILEINQKYLNHDYYTDIITFDQTRDGLLFADIVISVEMVTSNAEEYGEPFRREFLRVLIHGVLHLCGVDDQTEEQAKEMRQAEENALAMLPADLSEVWRK